MPQRVRWLLCFCLTVGPAPAQYEELYSLLSRARSGSADIFDDARQLLTKYPHSYRAHEEFQESARRIGRLQEAKTFYEHWLSDTALASYGRYGLARLERTIGNHAEALRHAERARKLNPDFVLSCSEWLAAMVALSRVAEAELVLIAESQQQRSDPAVRYALGMLWHRTKPKDALRLLTEAGHLRPRDPVILDGIIRALRHLHEYREAAAVAEKLLAVSTRSGDREWQCQALTWLSAFESDLGDYHSARGHLKDALAINAAIGSTQRTQTLLHELAGIDYYLGDHENAIASLQEALSIAEQRGDKTNKGRLLGILARVYADQPDYRRAILTCQQALELARTAKDVGSEADLLSELSRIHIELGQANAALQVIRQALELARLNKNVWLQARFLSIEGQAHAAGKDPAAAIRSYDSAATLATQLGDRYAAAQSLLRAAQANASLRRYSTARDSLMLAAQHAENTQALALTAEVQVELGRIQIAERRWKEAESSLQAALDSASRLRSRRLLALARGAMGELAEKQSNLPQALEHYQVALDAVEQTRMSLVDPEDRAAYVSGRYFLYRRAVACLVRLRRFAEAFELADRSRARAHLESVTTVEASKLEDSAEERNLRARLSRAQSALAAALTAQGTTERRLAGIRQTVNDAADAYELYTWNARQRSAPAPAHTNAGLDSIRQTLPPKGLLLEYSLGESSSYLFALSRDRLQTFNLPGRREIETDVATLHRALSAGPGRGGLGQFRSTAASLYTKLLGPVQRNVARSSTLIVVADGPLQTLPFELLLNEPTDGKYLIQSHVVEYAPSASRRVFAWSGKAPAGGILAVGDPAYGRGLKRLVESRREVEALRLRHQATSLLAAQATEQNVRANLARHRIMHLAVHAQVNTLRPQLSSLLLAPGTEADPADDGLLQAHEIARLPIPAELVVLSSCEGAVGPQLDGEGSVSLANAFLSAGVRQVVTSLWKVEDTATTELMTRFHQRLAEGGDAARALRDARLSLLRSNRWEHPFYWAGMILISGAR